MAQEVTIVAPYDSNVTSKVQEESVEAWKARGWTVKEEDNTPSTSAAVSPTSGGNVPPKAPTSTTPAQS